MDVPGWVACNASPNSEASFKGQLGESNRSTKRNPHPTAIDENQRDQSGLQTYQTEFSDCVASCTVSTVWPSLSICRHENPLKYAMHN